MKYSRTIVSIIIGSIMILPFHQINAATLSEETQATTEEDMKTSQSTEMQAEGGEVDNGSLSSEASDWLSKNLKDNNYQNLGLDTSFFTLASKPDGLGSVNQKYETLLEEFTQEGLGNTSKLEEAKLSEYTQDAEAVFTNTYGKLANQLKLSTPKIPKSINSSSYLKKAKKARDKAYKEQKKSSTYKKVKKGVNSSASLKKAKSKM
ncbi:hypothetical protein AALG99_07955 [Anaerostipes hominis (ex Lee et al. 2021)]|uniref:Uncharacterized protein n=1 Tax=Anaerostipes hominis (ex Lee et al. 2021) TaxID=2025494 RepID=A0ABV4DGP9_9FIRM